MVKTVEIPKYAKNEMTKVRIIDIGMLRCGFKASSPEIDYLIVLKF